LEELKNETDFGAAEVGESCVVKSGGVEAGDLHFAGGGEVHRAAQVEQRCLAAAAAAEERRHRSGFAFE
jgi:hypothetical protein